MTLPPGLPPEPPPPTGPPATTFTETAPPESAQPPRKSFVARTFGLSLGQTFSLLGLSTLVGFFVLAFDFPATGATFDLGGAVSAIFQRAMTAIGWAIDSFWRPALAGAVIVLPLWAIWRLIRAAFRK